MADVTKLMKLLEIAEKFGVKRSKVIGTQGNIVPFKKPSLVDIRVDEFKLKDSVDQGNITMDKVKQEMEETVKLALSKNLDDVELNRALNNAVNLDRVFFPPSAEVVAAGSGEKVTGKGLEELVKKQGLISPPSTPIGKIQFQGKRLEQQAKDLNKEFDLGELIKGAGKDQLSEIKLHNEGLVRAVTRQILSEDIKAGKIKGLTLEDLGTSREPIDYFRKIYGESALEQLDSLTPEFNRLNTEQEAAKFARTKFKFEPNETRTEGSTSYEKLAEAKSSEDERSFLDKLFGITKTKKKEPAEVLDITTEGHKRKSIDELIDEYNANQDRLALTDEEGGSFISYDEFNDIKAKNKLIADELETRGIKSTPEPEVETKPKGEIVPFRKKNLEPEEKSDGGRIGYAKGKRVMSSIDKLLEQLNTKLSKKKSMETVDPKTGEVTLPKKPIKRAEEPTGITVMDNEPDIVDEKKVLKKKSIMTIDDLKTKHKDAFEAHDQIFNVDINDKIAPDMIAESMAEKKGKDYFNLSQEEQSNLYKKALAYVDDVRMTKRQNKPIEGGFSFNDPDIKAQMEEAMTVAKKRGDEMRAMGLDPAKSRDYDQYIEIKTKSGDKDFNKYFDDLEIKTKFKGVISDDLLNQILIDDNPQRKAEVIATIEQGLTMQEKGMAPEEIINIIKNTTRTKQADGGIAGLL
jgi:hypothetical protein